MHDAGGDDREPATVLAVTLKGRAEQLGEIARILGEIEIVVDGAAGGPGDPDIVLVRISPDRVLEAVLSLNYHGFPEVRVYGPAAGSAR